MSDSLWLHELQSARFLCPWGFSRQEYWSGLPCPPPGDLPNPGIESRSPELQVDSLPTEAPGNMYAYIPSLLDSPVPPLWVITGQRAELPVLHGSFSLAVCLHRVVYISQCHSLSWTHLFIPMLCPYSLAVCLQSGLYKSVLLSQLDPPSRPHAVSICLFPTSTNRFICTVFLDSTCMC